VTTGEHKRVAEPKAGTLPPRERGILNLIVKVLEGHQIESGVLFDKPQISLPPNDIANVCRILKENPRTSFTMLLCIAAVDYKEHIQMVYLLLSMKHQVTLALKVNLPYPEPKIPSVSGVWRGADWHEREAHDLFGVHFEQHPNLSPLLLYEGFEGFPGRKEFPFHEYKEY